MIPSFPFDAIVSELPIEDISVGQATFVAIPHIRATFDGMVDENCPAGQGNEQSDNEVLPEEEIKPDGQMKQPLG